MHTGFCTPAAATVLPFTEVRGRSNLNTEWLKSVDPLGGHSRFYVDLIQ
jgi:hypothetical protein